MAITYHAGRRIQGLALTESDTTLDSTAGNNAWNTVYSSNGSTMTHYGGEHFTATKWRNLELKTFVIKYGKSSASSTGSHYLKVYGSDHTTQIGSTITGTPNVSSTATEGAGGTDVTFDLTGITSPNTEWFIGCGTSATGSAPTNIRVNTSSAGDGSNYWREYNGYNDYTSQSASFTLVYVDVSGDVKPTNVQAGSRFEETDTRKIYHYESPTPTFEDDFDTDAWTDSTSSVVGVSTGNSRFQFVAEAPDAANDSSVYDLGAGNVSDTTWILRWDVTYTNHVAGNGANHAFGITATNQSSTSVTADDGIMFCWGEPNTNTQSKMGVLALNGTAPSATGTFPNSTSRLETHLTNATKYYCTLSRDSATSSTFTIKTGSHDGTALSGFPLTNTADTVAGITGLRYIKFLNRSANSNRSGSSTGYIENLQFYNGVTTAGTAWSEEGT